MLMLVTADNFLQMFFGWEGVGLASYLLDRLLVHAPSATAAAMKAFIVNRVGDFGFALGIFGAFMVLGHADFDGAFHAAGEFATTGLPIMQFLGWQLDAMTVICLLLFMGAMGKSAQFLLHTWLPDAMEGPTPVSALIHAATMVTAGVFMVARLSPLFETSPVAMTVVLVIGAITAFFAATVGLVQNDIKRVIAYSTCSQLGYMFVALGAGAYSAGVFHLFTHAFFKALLFLGAGAVIHAMHHEQDMRNMGGLRKKIPITYCDDDDRHAGADRRRHSGHRVPRLCRLLLQGLDHRGGLCRRRQYRHVRLLVAGHRCAVHQLLLVAPDPPDLPRLAARRAAPWRRPPSRSGACGAAKAMTSRSTTAMRMTMTIMAMPMARPTTMRMKRPTSCWCRSMCWPLVRCWPARCSTACSSTTWSISSTSSPARSWSTTRSSRPPTMCPLWVKWSATFAMMIGAASAYVMYIRRPDLPGKLAAHNPGLYQFLLNKWYFDELYNTIFVKPALWIGRAFWKGFDDWLIDDKITEGLGRRVQNVTSWVTKLQSGYVYHYAFAMLIGVAALLTWAIAAGGLI